ncbi:MAG: Gfo/Idh/MocA family oxidoreductase [Pirellulales bacterium]|nr:Gfo/Idh/MocA family oxidoreductase [Pirellulales bacterium]
MRVLTAGGWKNGFLAYHLHEQQVRIAVRLWLRVHPINDAFVAYDRADWRKAIDYVRNIGLAGTWRKIRSRLSERERNRKYVAIGWGELVEAGPGCSCDTRPRSLVGFIAPFHPAALDEVCLHQGLVRPVTLETGRWNQSTVYTGDLSVPEFNWNEIAAWSEWSGVALDQSILDQVFDRVLPNVLQKGPAPDLVQLSSGGDASSDIQPPSRSIHRTDRKRAVIFGMGQYAKTVIAPKISSVVEISGWYEIDPTQIGPIDHASYEARTSMFPQDGDEYDVYFVAGFHHTHTPIAIHALRNNADVVVEKPLATTTAQLDLLLDGMRASHGRFFAGFHKRYNPVNQLIRTEIAEGQDQALSYRAIVHEIPLPAKHWYHWPNSGGAIICNGCHWIDHFLFLNNFSRPTRIDSRWMANGDIVVLMDLQNGASFSLVLTKHGSARLGVREIVWITAGDRTATVVDDRQYSAESSRRFLRKIRFHRHAASQQMYHEIGRRLVGELAGDSLESVDVSTRAMLVAAHNLAVRNKGSS